MFTNKSACNDDAKADHTHDEECSDTEREIASLHFVGLPCREQIVHCRDHPRHTQPKEHIHTIAS